MFIDRALFGHASRAGTDQTLPSVHAQWHLELGLHSTIASCNQNQAPKTYTNTHTNRHNRQDKHGEIAFQAGEGAGCD